MKNDNIAVIDLGSNSVRMIINSLKADGSFEKVYSTRSTVRLSQGMGVDNMLKESSINLVIDVLINFCAIASEYKCSTIVAVATAAVRRAANKDVFLTKAKEATGISFDIISGDDEAYYGYLAATKSLPLKNGVIFDTGGGSTEISLVKNGQLIHSESIPCGAVILSERFFNKPNCQLYKYVFGYISSIDWLDEAEGLDLYGMGGSARTLATLAKEEIIDNKSIHAMSIPYKKVAQIYQKIASTPLELRKNIKGMDKSRSDIILAGLTPAKVLMDILGSSKITICSYGVKEGVFFRVKDEILNKRLENQQ